MEATVSRNGSLDRPARSRAAVAGMLSLAGTAGLAASLLLIEAGERGALSAAKSRADCVFRAGAAREPWARSEGITCPLNPLSYCTAPLI